MEARQAAAPGDGNGDRDRADEIRRVADIEKAASEARWREGSGLGSKGRC
jgi:hypothetical protein